MSLIGCPPTSTAASTTCCLIAGSRRKSRIDQARLTGDRWPLTVDLDIAKSHSRPHVSDDNPYSESQFKTMKYRPDFPARFGCIEDARLHCQAFFAWYNTEHRHSSIGYMTPQAVHYGLAPALRELRQTALDTAFRASPRRFKGLRPTPGKLPTAVWINPPAPEIVTTQTPSPCTVNS